MKLFDIHCHVDLMPDMTAFAKQAFHEGIGIFAVTTTPKAYDQEKRMLEAFPNIKVGLGLHPQLIAERYVELSLFENRIANAKYVGEIGLDFNKQFYGSREKQLDAYKTIIGWCSQYPRKVISIHSVHSDKTALDVLESHNCTEKNKCILHWYSGSLAQLHRAVEMGCYFSINSAMIKSANGRRLLANIPLNRLLIETDAPFVNEVKTISGLKAEINEISLAIQSAHGMGTIMCIQETCKALIDI